MTAAERYLQDRAIPVEVARECGVEVHDDKLVYPHGRTRNLGGGPKMTQPSGVPLELWWPRGRDNRDVIVCEGESDALAAVAHTQHVAVACVPGTGYPVERLASDLEDFDMVYLAYDSDEAGQKAAAKVGEILRVRGVRTGVLPLPAGEDLASWLGMTPEDPSEALRKALSASQRASRPGVSGAEFLLDQELTVKPIWGDESRCLWASGEPFFIFSPPGVGKSTIAQNLAMARIGLTPRVLEQNVTADAGRVLYVAADRPTQVARSWRRMVVEDDREVLENFLTVWTGAPPFTISKQPDALLPWIKTVGEVGTLIVDSMFNIAPSLSEEEGAANANNAFQSVVAAGIEVLAMHHDRKRDQADRKRVTQDDMYGGRPISGGAGSICYLDGEPNSGEFEARWLKAPAGPVPSIEGELILESGQVKRASLSERPFVMGQGI